jgi:hypothetical protein
MGITEYCKSTSNLKNIEMYYSHIFQLKSTFENPPYYACPVEVSKNKEFARALLFVEARYIGLS